MKECGIGIGTIIAAIMSWHFNGSVLYMVLHACLGWFYVVYKLTIGA